ncbi:molybdate ABC transporter permease subunit [Brevibacillus migulae]|uniref:molybdate ABC transporter permease subunit n=1 Tax=Brevibacillus migulae TaxID=1644114 RepID=UPI00106ECE54|nr:molybdate ABC transporter permease subunit [Brevibacillus migulae]
MIDHEQFWTPIYISLKIATVASIFVFILGVCAAWYMARKPRKGRLIVETILLSPLVLPPTVVGFGLLVLFGRNSWLGKGIEWLFGQPIVFTWWAAVIAGVVVSFPLVYQTIKTGFESVDKELEEIARTMGAGEAQVFWHVTLPLSWRFLLSAFMFGFARAMGEFGATLMFAGNIPGKTENIPTAIYLAVESGDMRSATYWVIAMIIISFLLLSFIHKLNKR